MKENNDIGFKVRILSNLIKRDVEKSKSKLGIDLPNGINGWAISYFYEHLGEDVFQKDFETEFSIRRSTASNILKTMEQKGFIKRVSVESDARLKKIVLTDKAVDIHETILKSINKREERLRNGLSEQKVQTFLNVVDKLIANMEDSND